MEQINQEILEELKKQRETDQEKSETKGLNNEPNASNENPN